MKYLLGLFTTKHKSCVLIFVIGLEKHLFHSSNIAHEIFSRMKIKTMVASSCLLSLLYAYLFCHVDLYQTALYVLYMYKNCTFYIKTKKHKRNEIDLMCALSCLCNIYVLGGAGNFFRK